MSDSGAAQEILPGWDVRDAHDDLVGTVIEATPSYVLVEQGRFFPDDVFIPLDIIAAIEPGIVRLSLSGQDALAETWHTAPPVGAGFGSTDTLAPGLAIAGQVDELGTTEEDAVDDGERVE